MPQTLQPYDISKLRKVFSLCKFKLTHRPCNKIFTIMSITAKPASEITFILSGRDGAPYTVTNIAAYFRTAYNINLRYPNLVSRLWNFQRSCLILVNPALCSVRSENYVPMEYIALEPFNSLPPGKFTSDQVSPATQGVCACTHRCTPF